MPLKIEDQCPNCHAWHGETFLKNIPIEGPCPFVMGQPCRCCHKPVMSLSFGGPTICSYCDTGACHRYGHPAQADLQLQPAQVQHAGFPNPNPPARSYPPTADWAELLRAELGEDDELMAEELEHYDEQELGGGA